MKNIATLFLLFLLIGCSDKHKAIMGLIVQNNKHYNTEIEEYKLDLKQKGMDDRHRFNKEYYQSIDTIFKAIKQLKTKTEYDIAFEKIKELGYEYKIGKNLKSVHSDDLEILKNSLYVNLLNVTHAEKIRSAIPFGSGCRLSELYKVVKTTKKDSVSLDIYTYNQLQVNVDGVSDGDDHLAYKSNNQYKVWSIKYKPKSKNTHCTGKIFFRDPEYRRLLMVQEFDDRNALVKNPFK